MSRWRSRPVEIDAVRFVGIGLGGAGLGPDRRVPDWFLQAGTDGLIKADAKGPCLWIKTLEGTMCARPGDWIIRGTEGELYPCKDSVFQRKYEPVA
jgi:hypothetical protein